MADSSMRLNVIMGMVDRITSPMQKVTGQTERMSERVKKSQQELERLGATSKDIDHFKKLKRSVGDASKQIGAAQQRVDDLARHMRNAEKPSRSLTREFNKAKREVDSLRDSHQRETRELQDMRRRLNDAGVSTRNLNDATHRIRQETQKYTQDLERQQKALDDTANRQKRMADAQERNRGLRSSALMDTAKLTAGAFAVSRFTSAYGELADAQGEIRSLGIEAEGIDKITQKAKEFSNEFAGTTAPDFIRASYDIKSGISTLSDAAVGEFTKIAGMTAAATKSTTDQMTGLFATGYGIYRQQFEAFGAEVIDGWQALSAEERDMKFGEYFSAGIASAVKAYKTNGSEMSAAISNLGSTATSANVPFEEQLAILGELQRTMSGSESATKYRAFLNAASGAGEKLNLTFTDANDQLLSTPEILDQLRSKYGETLDAVESQELKKAFGTDEAVAMIKLLYSNVDGLRGGIDDMGESVKRGTESTEEMARAMQNGPNKATERMTQQVQNATAALGKAFAPVVITVASVIGDTAMSVADLTERFPLLGQIMAIIAVVMMSLMATSILSRFAFAGLSDAVIFGRKAFDFLRWSTIKTNVALAVSKTRAIATATGMVIMGTAQKALAAGAAVMTGAQWALNAAMNANPIGLVIAGIALLVAAVALIYRYWEPLSGFFMGLWESIKGTFSAGWEYITGLLGFNPLSLVTGAWSGIPDFFAGMWEGVMGIFSRALDWITGSVLGPISKIKDTLGGAWNSLFGDDDAKQVEVTRRVSEISAAVPPDLRSDPEFARNAEQAGNATGGVPASAVGSVAAAGGGTTVIDQSDRRSDIYITQQPGQSAQDVGEEVRKQLDARDRQRARRERGRLVDG